MKLPPLRGLPRASLSGALINPLPSFHEDTLNGSRYHWGGNSRHNRSETRTFIVLERESRTIFSSIRILFYFKQSPPSRIDPEFWDFQLLGSVTHTSRGQIPSPNNSSLPVLTIAFELKHELSLTSPPTAFLAVRSLSPDDITNISRSDILFEHESCLNLDTSSLQLSFTHTVALDTSNPVFLEPWCLKGYPGHPTQGCLTTRIVRVVPPRAVASASKTAGDFLPNEIFLQIFEDRTFSQEELLSLARVCYAWGRCAIEVLRARWNSGELARPYLLSSTLEAAPVLGLGIMSLQLIDPAEIPSSSLTLAATSLAVRILIKTKNLEFLHLEPFDRSQSNALVAALRGLRSLHTLILGRSSNRARWRYHKDPSTIPSIVHLSQFLLVLPSLRSLEVHHLQPGAFGARKLILSIRPPRSPLTHLTLTRSKISDSDLMHLFSFSAKTLEVVILDTLEGITNPGLLTFLRAISQTVCHLRVYDVGVPSRSEREVRLALGKTRKNVTERALDVVVKSMPHLRELHINGDVATGLMLERRSKAFLCSCAESWKGLSPIPVVQIWAGNRTVLHRLHHGAEDRAGWAFLES